MTTFEPTTLALGSTTLDGYDGLLDIIMRGTAVRQTVHGVVHGDTALVWRDADA